MTAARSPDSRRWIIIVVVVLLLVIGICLAKCRRTEVATAIAPVPAPQPEAPLSLPPGIEVVSRDIAAGLIVLREKSSGETVQLRLSEANPEAIGRAFAQRATTRAPQPLPSPTPVPSPPPPAVLPPVPPPVTPPAVASSTGPATPPPAAAPVETAVAGSSLPNFLPEYPGAKTLRIANSRANGATHGEYEFSSPDSPDAVGKFYQDKMTAAGLLVVANVAGKNQAGPTYTLLAEDDSGARSISLTVHIEDGRARAMITFVAK